MKKKKVVRRLRTLAEIEPMIIPNKIKIPKDIYVIIKQALISCVEVIQHEEVREDAIKGLRWLGANCERHRVKYLDVREMEILSEPQ